MYGENRGGFRPRGGMGGGFAPVQVGEELDVRIEAVGEKGDGIARKKGFVLFVPNTKEGDEVRIKVTKVLRKVGFAEVVGQAQGPIEEDAGPAPRQEREDRYEEPAPMPAPEPSPEDSEDFGEELLESEEKDESMGAPAEETSEETPAEEPAEPESPKDDLEVPPPPEDDGEEKKEESM